VIIGVASGILVFLIIAVIVIKFLLRDSGSNGAENPNFEMCDCSLEVDNLNPNTIIDGLGTIFDGVVDESFLPASFS
jgi:hypothetical protein